MGLRYLGWMHTGSCKSAFLLLLDVTVRVYCGLTVLLLVHEHLPGSCQTSPTVACTNICLYYVACEPQFTSHFWKGFCSLIRATISLYTVPFTVQCADGVCEPGYGDGCLMHLLLQPCIGAKNLCG